MIEFAFGGHDFDASGIFQMPPRVGVPGITLRYHTKHIDIDIILKEIDSDGKVKAQQTSNI